jgi:predicted acyl esterase
VAAWTFHPPTAATLLGPPHLHVTATPTGTNAELAARLFDLNPATGTQTLITRAIYRITGTPGHAQQISLELWPTAWQLLPGHQLTLELTQTDTPTWRADNQPAALTLTNLELTVPTHT